MSAPENTLVTPKSLRNWIEGCLNFVSVGTSLILLIGVVLLGQVPPIQSGDSPETREARTALGAMKDRARVIYQRTAGLAEVRKEDLGLGADELDGKHFKQSDYACGGTPEKWWAQVDNVFSAEPRHLRIESNLVTGESRFNR